MTTSRTDDLAADDRRSPIPTLGMITSRCNELRRRRGLMATVIAVTVGIPAVFLAVRLVLHAVAPKTYGPAGGYHVYIGLVSGVLYTFGFIVAAALGATAGSGDLTDGMFRHQVVTGRSRVALYLARIPAGLAIICSLVAVGFAIVCTVCVLAAPTTATYNGVSVPAGLSKAGLEDWAAGHTTAVICSFNYRVEQQDPLASVIPTLCFGPGRPAKGGGAPKVPASLPPATRAQLVSAARHIADSNYADYAREFLSPPVGLMLRTWLWLELGATIGFVVGLGLGSLTGQRTATVIIMVILEVILTPILSRAQLPHLINLQRAVVGLATAHLAPGALPVLGGGAPGNAELVPEARPVAVIVVIAWLVGWTVIGAWRMQTRDA